jgi:hypothetical protein
MNSIIRTERTALVFLSALLVTLVSATASGVAADHGRVAGRVSDPTGNPLMGASVVIVGPLVSGLASVEAGVQRVITDAHGKFSVERLSPGWYSIKVTSPTRLPALRNRVRVEAGGTALENFVLADILSALTLQVPAGSVSSWGEDWKWVLRTSATTRPVLRYRDNREEKRTRRGEEKVPLPPGQTLVGMTPGTSRNEALSGDLGLGSVLAYLRPIAEDTDLLVAGSMGTGGLVGSSVVTAIRKDLLKGDPQELALIVHRLSFAEGFALAGPRAGGEMDNAQGVVVSYSHTRRISKSLTVTTGMRVDYLNTFQDARMVRPRLKVEYALTPSTSLAFQHGSFQPEGDSTLMERIGTLNSFPRVTLRGYRPQLESLRHTEIEVARQLGESARIELAAYRDRFNNTAVWGFGSAEALNAWAGDFLPNPAADGVTLNAGRYESSGLRVTYTQDWGSRVRTAMLYALGDALEVDAWEEFGREDARRNLQNFLRPERTHLVAGKLITTIPKCNTQITTSYGWLPQGLVTSVDPYGQSAIQVQPFLGVQVRQPLPTLAFLPARIEAMADFRNLLAQGYVPLSRSSEETLLLTPAYRSFRGGFSVQF